MTPSHIKYQCLCCDHFTLDEEPAYYRPAPPRCPLCASTRSVCSAPVHAQRGPVQRCPVCGWISDFYQEHDVQLRGRPNEVSLREAQDNYRRGGATHRAALATVRPRTLLRMPRSSDPRTSSRSRHRRASEPREPARHRGEPTHEFQ